MKRKTKKLVGLLLAASSITCAASCKSNEISDTTSTLSEPSISTSVESTVTETTTLTSVITLNTTSALVTAADTIAPETQAPAASTQAGSTPIEVTTTTTQADNTSIETTTSTTQGTTFVDTTVAPQTTVEEITTTTTSDAGDYYEVPEVESTTTSTMDAEGTLDITNVTDEDLPMPVYGPASTTLEDSMIITAGMNDHLYESFAEYAGRYDYVADVSNLTLLPYLEDCSNLSFPCDDWRFPLRDWLRHNDHGFFVHDGNIYWVNLGVNADEPVTVGDDIVVIKLRNDHVYWSIIGNRWYLVYEEDGTYYSLDFAMDLDDVVDVEPSVDVYGPAPDYEQTVLVYGPAPVD